MKTRETLQILSNIANSLDNNNLFKEATIVTKMMTKIAQDTNNNNETENGGNQLAKYSEENPMPKAEREKYYQKIINTYKQQLLSGENSAEEFYAHIYGANSDPMSLYDQTVPNGFLIEEQVEAMKKQFGRILRELNFKSPTDKLTFKNDEDKQKFSEITNQIHGLIDAYLRNRKMTIKDLEKNENQSKIIKDLSKKLGKDDLKLDLLNDIVTGYSKFNANEGSTAPSTPSNPGSTPPKGAGLGDVRSHDSKFV